MKYNRDQDIEAIISSIRTGKPKKRNLTIRLLKKYGPKSVIMVLDAFYKMKKKRNLKS
jgi:hypothetical protein